MIVVWLYHWLILIVVFGWRIFLGAGGRSISSGRFVGDGGFASSWGWERVELTLLVQVFVQGLVRFSERTIVMVGAVGGVNLEVVLFVSIRVGGFGKGIGGGGLEGHMNI